MAKLWYRGYWTFGVPYEKAIKVAAEIRKNRMGSFLPKVCYEPSRKKDQFYLFIAIQSDQLGSLPKEVRDFENHLQKLLHLNQFPGGDAIYQEDLTQTWLKREIDVAVTRQIARWKWEDSETQTDIADAIYFTDLREHDETSRQAYNYLLFWLSANGEGSWSTFQKTAEQLGISTPRSARQLMRRLTLLGHTEYLDDDQHWTICPSCFVQVDEKENKYTCILTGARSQRLVEALSNNSISSAAIRGGPDLIKIEFESFEEARALTYTIERDLGPIKLVGNSSLKLAEFLPGLSEWKNYALKPISIDPHRYKILQWDGAGFGSYIDLPVQTGFYELTDTQASGLRSPYHYFYDAEKNMWLQGEFYGLQYLANQVLGKSVKLVYHSGQRLFLIPGEHHLPSLYERAIILASGELPKPIPTGLLYKNISPVLAENIASRVNAQLEIKA